MRPLEKALNYALSLLAGVSVLFLLSIVIGIVIARNVLGLGLPWLDELARYVQLWLIYLGSVVLVIKDDHITMDAVYTRLPAPFRRGLRRLTGLLYLAGCGIAGYFSLLQAWSIARAGETSASGVLPAAIGYASLPVGFGLMIVASLYFLFYRSQFEPEREIPPA